MLIYIYNDKVDKTKLLNCFHKLCAVVNSLVHYIACKSLRKFVYRWNVNNYTNISLPFATYPTLDNELLRCSHEQIARWGMRGGESSEGGERRAAITRNSQVLWENGGRGCVFDLNRGNFSAITKFIGTALARPTRPAAGARFFLYFFFLLRSCSIQPGPRENRKDAQETAVVASLHSLISRVEEEPLHSKSARYRERRNSR